MNAAEVLQLCRLVKACCPSQTLDEYTPQAWGLILADCAYVDAKQAVAELVRLPLEPGRARYIEPGHIIAGVQRIRSKRLAESMPEPPSGLDADAYLAWLRTTRAAVADGAYLPPDPPPPARPELVAQIRAIASTLAIDTTPTKGQQ